MNALIDSTLMLLFAKVFTQTYSVDYYDTFSLVVPLSFVHFFIYIIVTLY